MTIDPELIISILALCVSLAGIALSFRANHLAKQSNKISEEANGLSKESNGLSKAANGTARQALMVAGDEVAYRFKVTFDRDMHVYCLMNDSPSPVHDVACFIKYEDGFIENHEASEIMAFDSASFTSSHAGIALEDHERAIEENEKSNLILVSPFSLQVEVYILFTAKSGKNVSKRLTIGI